VILSGLFAFYFTYFRSPRPKLWPRVCLCAGPVAQAMLVYGQSTDPKSPYYADQLPLYSRKEWPALPFTEASINADPNRNTATLAE
ncbi:penicillin acylase family protein, partial [Telluria mixta]